MVKKIGEVDWFQEFQTVLKISKCLEIFLSVLHFDHHFDDLYLTNGWFFGSLT